jgi:HlyD family secretion protein
LTKVQLAKRLSGDSEVIQEASDLLDAVKQELQDAQKAYDALLTTQEAQDVLRARAALSVAQERYNTARDWLQSLQTGEHAPQVRIAAVALEQAKAALLQAQAGVRQAQANLALLETQMQKLTIYAPRDGVILSRAVEPGEFLQPGATALTLADLSQLTVTVYIPEDRYGQLHLGQAATIRVDSFPGETFQASIVYISDQAEFTPRNVQTVEGRSTTVYAVKLRVEDSTARLKPGMPADVFFEQ